MRPTLIPAIHCLFYCLFVVFSAPAQVVTDAVGYITLTIKGHDGRSSSALSFIGITLTRPVLGKGTIESVDVHTIKIEQADWLSQFQNEGGNYYLEITSGSAAGYIIDIMGIDPLTGTLNVAGDLSQIVRGGEAFKINPHWTLASLFGPANESGLGSGSNLTADQVMVYDSVAGRYTTYYYKTSGLGGTGWRSTASASADQANAPLDFREGVLIRRKQADDLKLKIFGLVRSGQTYLSVFSGLNIIGNVYPSSALTLGSSGLFTGDDSTGIAGGSHVSADKILIYNGVSYEGYYYKTAGLGGTGWRSTASSTEDASNVPLPIGASILIQRGKDRPAFYWLIRQPY